MGTAVEMDRTVVELPVVLQQRTAVLAQINAVVQDKFVVLTDANLQVKDVIHLLHAE